MAKSEYVPVYTIDAIRALLTQWGMPGVFENSVRQFLAWVEKEQGSIELVDGPAAYVHHPAAPLDGGSSLTLH